MTSLKNYLITDPKYYSNDIYTFEKKLREVLEKNKINMACFRDKESSNYEELALVFVKICKEFQVENIFINQYINLGYKLKANGVHLTSKQFEQIQKAKDLGLKVIISCHTKEELNKAKENDVYAVTYSPIFHTPNKADAKGIKHLNEILKEFNDMKIIALGGIKSQEEVKQISSTSSFAFGSIRYFI